MLNRKGQNTAEYAIVIALVVGAAIGVQNYVRGSIQSKVGAEVDKLSTIQYADYDLQVPERNFDYFTAQANVISDKEVTEKVLQHGEITRDVLEATKRQAEDEETFLWGEREAPEK